MECALDRLVREMQLARLQAVSRPLAGRRRTDFCKAENDDVLAHGKD
jgi:hypothetical protein